MGAFSPSALALAGVAAASVLVSVPSAWFARGVIFDHIERPRIEQAATEKANDAAAIRVMDAAKRAEAAERERQQRAGAEALRIYREALADSQRAAEETQTRLEQEIAAYEAELISEGRSCVFTDADIDWLYGRRAPGTN